MLTNASPMAVNVVAHRPKQGRAAQFREASGAFESTFAKMTNMKKRFGLS